MIELGNWKKVAAVLVNYNDCNILEDCIKSLYKQLYTNLTVVVVDNGSADSSLNKAMEKYPDIKGIFLEKNLGWGAGCNAGIAAAIRHGCEYVLLLNTDTEAEEDMLLNLMRYAGETAVTVPYMYYDIERKLESDWYAGGEIDYKTAEVRQHLYPKMGGINEEPREVGFITGCCMLVHKDIFRKIGIFDERYFMYYEDVDYSLRMKINGIKMVYVPHAALWHKVGSSGGGEISYINQYYMVRNQLLFAQKYSPYMDCSITDVLRRLLEGRSYFEVPITQKYKKFVCAGMEDFLRGNVGKEKNWIFDFCYYISGFYPSARVGDMLAHWSGEKKAVIEIFNPYPSKTEFHLSCWIGVPGALGNPEMNIVLEGKWSRKVQLPCVFDCSYILEPKEHCNLILATESEWFQNQNTRILSFQLGDVKIVPQQDL